MFAAFERLGVPYTALYAPALAVELGECAPGLVLQRCVSQWRGLSLARAFQAAGSVVFNRPEVIETCGDKLATSAALVRESVPTPRTSVAMSRESALAEADRLGYPVVIKPLMGSWGRLVARLDSRAAAEALLEYKEVLGGPEHKVHYLQEYVDKPGRDIRAFVIGDRVVAAMRRVAQGQEFRSNVHRGGRTEPVGRRRHTRGRPGRVPSGSPRHRSQPHHGVPQLDHHDGRRHPGSDRQVRGVTAGAGGVTAATVGLSILGASGYAGGEFLRLALGHPRLRVDQVTSRAHAGQPVHLLHPNLRGVTDLRFTDPADLRPNDVLVAALPHGALARRMEEVSPLASCLVDLSEDFRLTRPESYEAQHEGPHPRPDLLGTFVYANPELNREQLRGATRLAGAGCIATAAVLALHPVVGLLDTARDVIVDAKIGSSAAGSAASSATHHPERSGAVRTYAPTRHRHQAEITEVLPGAPTIHVTATAIERVRGVLVAAHTFVREGVAEPDVLAAFRRAYDSEPFVRLVRARRGIHRVPDPKILDGSNYCDVGFALDECSRRLVVMAALDNLVKGTAGHALQSLNLALGFPEAAGLGFTGLHP